MSIVSNNIIKPEKSLKINKKKRIILGAIIILAVFLIPAIGLQFNASDTSPSDMQTNLETGADIENTNKTCDNFDTNENMTSENKTINDHNSQNNNDDITETDNTISDHNVPIKDDTSSNPDPVGGGGSPNLPDDSDSQDDSSTSDGSKEENETSSDPENCIIELPSYKVNAKVKLDMNQSYFITNITGIYGSYDISNNSFLTWCIDYGEYMNYSLKNVSLYSSYCPPDLYQLPADNWSAVNYIVNNKPKNVSYFDIQTAIWYYVNFGSNAEEPTDRAWDIINDTENNNGTSFIPEAGEIIAVIVESDFEPENDQLSIIEQTIPELPGIPNITINKTINQSNASIGETINYSYLVTNTGETIIECVQVIDDKLGSISLNQTILAPDEKAIGWKEYIIQETDAPGPLVNTAEVTGFYNSSQIINASDNASISINYHTSINISKKANKNSAKLDDTVNYSYTVINNGDVSLENIQVIDDKIGAISLNSTALSPNQKAIGFANYVITCADIEEETHANNATVSANTSFNESVTNRTMEEIMISYKPNITIEKTVQDLYDQSWQNKLTVIEESILLFNITIRNTGEELLSDVLITDMLPLQLSYINASFPPASINGSSIEWIIPELQSNETQIITYSAMACQLGMGHNNVTTITELCNDLLLINDSISINVLTCPTEIWIDDDWQNQSQVDNFNESLIYHYNAFNTIQHGVDSICECGNIYVKNGTYEESITIMKNLRLQAIEKATIIAPSMIPGIFVAESSIQTQYLISLLGGSYNETSNTVDGPDTITVELSGFILDVNQFNSTQRWATILYRNIDNNHCNKSSIIANNTLINPSLTNNLTYGILGYGNSSVLIKNNTINQFSHRGIEINEGSVDVSENDIIGPGTSVPPTFEPIGIQLGFGTTGSIKENEISSCGLPGKNSKGMGIKIIDTSNVTIQSNNIYGNKLGCSLYDHPSINGTPYSIRSVSQIDVLDNDFEYNEIALSIVNNATEIDVFYNRFWNMTSNAIEVYALDEWYNWYNESNPAEIDINHNWFRHELCLPPGVGLWVGDSVSSVVDARYNYWGQDDGPSGNTIDIYTGRSANDIGGEEIQGVNISFDKYAGICADFTVSDTTPNVGDIVVFDASDSYAVYINGSSYQMNSYQWDIYKNNQYQYTKFGETTTMIFQNSGEYKIRLRVKSSDPNLNYWGDTSSSLLDEMNMMINVS